MGKKILKYTGRVLLVILVTAVMLVGIVYAVIHKIANGSSQAARDTFVTTILETGQMKFLASWVCSKDEINEIQARNELAAMDEEVDASKININPEAEKKKDDLSKVQLSNKSFSADSSINTEVTTSIIDINTYVSKDIEKQGEEKQEKEETFDENGIRVEEISGLTFFAKMMIIKDPSQVVVGTSSENGSWGEYGLNLDELITRRGGIAGVNGGLYVSTGNKGGKPMGVVVENGQITLNQVGSVTGLYLIGFNEDNILIIKNLEGMSKDDFENYVKTEKIRDAVGFQEESSDKNNHFVPVVINGKGREVKGFGGGSNPRTVIGQRADGAILLLVTDGRGSSGHLGATADDLVGIMLDYGAVNAANLDGGSSSSMWYNEYLMTSVTFYYKNSSWKMPTSFVVMPK